MRWRVPAGSRFFGLEILGQPKGGLPFFRLLRSLLRARFALGRGEGVHADLVFVNAHAHQPKGASKEKADADFGQPKSGFVWCRVKRFLGRVVHTPFYRGSAGWRMYGRSGGAQGMPSIPGSGRQCNLAEGALPMGLGDRQHRRGLGGTRARHAPLPAVRAYPP